MEKNKKPHLTNINLEITRYCNLDCKFCFLGEEEKVNFSKDRFSYLLDELVDLGVFTVTITGGEPFINKDIYFFIEQLRDKGFKVGILTNGSLVTKDVAGWLCDWGVKDIKISLYGGSEETYENFTGERKFEQTFQGVKNLVNFGINTTVLFNINNITYKDISIVKNIFKNMNGVKLKFTACIAYLRNSITSCGFSPLDYEIPLEDIFQILCKYGIEVEEFNKPYQLPVQFKEPIPCNVGISRCYITADGDILPCAMYPINVGNIYRQSLKEIWHESEYLKKIRKLNIEDFTDCKICKYKTLCKFRCPSASETEENNIIKCPESVRSRMKKLYNFWQGGNYER